MLDKIRGEIQAKLKLLQSLQRPDGSIPSYLEHDEGGVWTTSEVLYYCVNRQILPPSDEFCQSLAGFISERQRADGGFTYRSYGNSFTDPTSWALIALSFYEQYAEQIRKGVAYLVSIRLADEAGGTGWGIQEKERDRTYSTSMAVYTLSKLRNRFNKDPDFLASVDAAISEGLHYLHASKNSDGGWGAARGTHSDVASTSIALQVLFRHGVNPADHMDSLEYLLANRKAPEFLWESVEEIMPLRMGLEISMQWFAQPQCLKALIFFAELHFIDIDSLVKAAQQLLRFTKGENDFVDYSIDAIHKRYTWTIPHYIDALSRVERYLKQNKNEYREYVTALKREGEKQRRELLYNLVQEEFPYPLADAFFRFARETDPLTRFRRMILAAETLLTFLSSLAVVSYANCHTIDKRVSDDLADSLHKPSLGDWNRFLTRIGHCRICVEQDCFLKYLEPLVKTKKIMCATKHLDLSLAFDKFIALRNRFWGHGSMVSAYEYKQHISEYSLLLEEVLGSLDFLKECNLFFVLETEFDEFDEKEIYTITSCKGLRFGATQSRIESTRRLSKGMGEPEVKYLYLQDHQSGHTANLYPFWFLRFCEDCKSNRFFSYSSLRDTSIEYFSYECGHFARLDNVRHLDLISRRIFEERPAS